MADPANVVSLKGKISRSGQLRYTPAGVAMIEFTLAVSQSCLGENTIGYFEAIASGGLAEELASQLRVGKSLALEGRLWTRSYRNRKGTQVSETKVVIDRLGG